MTTCNNCGRKNDDEATACGKCGSGLPRPTATPAPHPDSDAAIVADLKTVVPEGSWADWRQSLATRALEKREQQVEPAGERAGEGKDLTP